MARCVTAMSRLGIVLVFFVSSWLAGCGQTGALYLPDDGQPESQQESQQEPRKDEATQDAPAE